VNLDSILKVSQVLEGLATTAAVIGGGLWAYYSFKRRREHLFNIRMTIGSVFEYLHNGLVLLSLSLELQNVGTKVFRPGPKGLEVSIRHLRPPTNNGEALEWAHGISIVEDFDILAPYRDPVRSDYEGEAYSLETGCIYAEPYAIALEAGQIYMVRARLWDRDSGDKVTTYKVIQAPASQVTARGGAGGSGATLEDAQ
jgi:hypothetical protein